jgi:MFS family permease
VLQREGTGSRIRAIPGHASRIRRQTFAALSIPNFRRYYAGQAISMVGTWMQTVAQAWLVLQLTGSGTAVGLVVALQTLPVLLLGPYAGVVADRHDKRRLMIRLQITMSLLSLVLGLLTITNTVALWHVYTLAVLLGSTNAFENPARQAFLMEMVGPADLRNAISLNSVLVNVARAVGPAAAGIIIALGGLGICFLLNSVSVLAVLFSLATLDLAALTPVTPARRGKGQLREGLAYVRRTPELAIPLVMMALVGCLAYEFQVVLPIVAADTFGGDSRTYGFMTASMGAGAIVGGLWVAARGRTGTRTLIRTSAAFGIAIGVAAVAPTLWLEYAALMVTGFVSIGFLSKGNSTLQLAADPMMRGRVLALWSVAFLGSTPIGGPIAGWVAEQFGGRAALAMGAVACLVAAGLGWLMARRAATSPLAGVVDHPAASPVEVAEPLVVARRSA